MEPAPGNIFSTVMQTIHGHVGHVVLGVGWEWIGEDDSLAMPSNEICVATFRCGRDVQVASVSGARGLKDL